METTQVSTDGWMDKENAEHVYTGILVSGKKKKSYNFQQHV